MLTINIKQKGQLGQETLKGISSFYVDNFTVKQFLIVKKSSYKF